MPAVAASPIPRLTVLDGGRRSDDPISPRELVDVENAWIEVQAVAHEAETFVALATDAARRIQIAVAKGRYGLAGQYAHDLEVAAPRYGVRARRSELEAQEAIARLHGGATA